MPVRVLARVNPRLVRWAREERGFDLTLAAKKLQVTEERLARWEVGEEQPTLGQLRKLAATYRRPTAAFYLKEVPTSFRVKSDFRRLPGEVAQIYSPELRLELRNIAYHREVAVELCNELGETPPSFSFKATLSDDPEDAGGNLRDFLDVDRVPSDPRGALDRWRRAIEARGVLVFQLASVRVWEMRGFSIWAEPLPIVAVNRKDALVGRAFSLLHEVVHLALRRDGLCDIDESAPRPPQEQKMEVFCNHVAAAALVPAKLLLEEPGVIAHESTGWADGELRAIGNHFGVSREAILRRLLTFGKTTSAFYQETLDRWRREQQERQEPPEDTRDSRFARNMPAETLGLLGRTFVQLVFDTYNQDRLTLSDVSTYLGVRVKHIGAIEQRLRAL